MKFSLQDLQKNNLEQINFCTGKFEHVHICSLHKIFYKFLVSLRSNK
jgi:hypothetical protein